MNNLHQEIQNYIQREIEALQNIPLQDSIGQTVDLIHEQVHVKGGKVVISGMGKAGQIGANIATTLSSTGTPAVFLHPSEAQHGDLGVVQYNDVLLLISNSGRTREILELQQLAHQLYPHLPIIGISGHQSAEFTAAVNILMLTGAPQEICPLGLTPTTSTTVMTVMGDILVVMLMKKIGFTRQQYAMRHHGGYLGLKVKQHE